MASTSITSLAWYTFLMAYWYKPFSGAASYELSIRDCSNLPCSRSSSWFTKLSTAD